MRLLGAAINEDMRWGTSTVDVGGVLRWMFLLDTYTLDSKMFGKFSSIIERLGYSACLKLLESGDLKIKLDAVITGQIGQLGALQSCVKKGLLFLVSYSFQSVTVPNWAKYLQECFVGLEALVQGTRSEKSMLISSMYPSRHKKK